MAYARFILLLAMSGSLTGCMVEPTYYPPPATAGSPQPAGAGPQAAAGYSGGEGQAQGAGYVPPGAPIEAGCSYTGRNIEGGVGGVFQVACPAGCQQVGGLWGTDVYTADSAICRAGIHAGAISPAGGVVTVRLDPGRPAYRGTARYGVESGDYGTYPMSYTVFLPTGPQQGAPVPAAMSAPAEPVPAVTSAQVIEAGCSFNASQIRAAMGTAHRVSCPPGCERTGGLWGTDMYTGDSGICRAAIHAGLISPQGGAVTVILEPGRPAYRGSTRYGIQSGDYGSYGSSFRLGR
jgi:hypothetical protein